MEDSAPLAASPAPAREITHGDLFRTFARIGLLGFGGVTPWLRQVLVVERGWLDDREFAELFGFASVLPGANTVSLSIMLGDRYQGFSGSIVALTGLLVMPLLILAGVASLYSQYGDLPDVRNAIAGAAAATAGLVIGNGVRMTINMKPDIIAYVIGLSVFIASGVLQLPLLWILLTIGPASVAILAFRNVRQ